MPAGLDAETIGPVDVAVILFEKNEFNGDVAPALVDLDDSGTVRIIDLAFVRKDDDGSVSYAEVADEQVAETFERLHDAEFDLLSDEDLSDIAGGLEAGSSALVIVWENTWAGRFAAAIRASHGQLISQDRIPREIVLRAIAALGED